MEDIIKKISVFKTEEEYRESSAVSYSQIAAFFRGGIVDLRKEVKPTEEMKFGSLLKSLMIYDNSSEYYRWYRANKDKIPITQDYWERAVHCREQIMLHPLVKRVMRDYEVYYRVKIATDLSDIGVGYCKSMLDAVVVDSNHKLLIPVGIKTMGEDECFFEKSVVKWQYWLQALMYSDILRFALRDKGIYDWQVVSAFYFVVANREDPKPLIYKFSTDSMARAKYPDWIDVGCRLKRYLDNPDRDTPFGVSRSMTVSLDERLVKDYPFGFKDTNR